MEIVIWKKNGTTTGPQGKRRGGERESDGVRVRKKRPHRADEWLHHGFLPPC